MAVLALWAENRQAYVPPTPWGVCEVHEGAERRHRMARPRYEQERDVVFTALYANPQTSRKQLARLTGRSPRWVQRVVKEWEDQGPEVVEKTLERMRSMTRYGAELQLRRFVVAAMKALAVEPEAEEVHKLAADVQKWATIFGFDAPQRVLVAEVDKHPWEHILDAVTGEPGGVPGENADLPVEPAQGLASGRDTGGGGADDQ